MLVSLLLGSKIALLSKLSKDQFQAQGSKDKFSSPRQKSSFIIVADCTLTPKFELCPEQNLVPQILVELERIPDPARRPGPEEKLAVKKPNTLYYPGSS